MSWQAYVGLKLGGNHEAGGFRLGAGTAPVMSFASKTAIGYFTDSS